MAGGRSSTGPAKDCGYVSQRVLVFLYDILEVTENVE